MSGPRTQATSARLAVAGPNLARRPFTNQRPVKRISLLLLGFGLLLLLVDVWLYTSYVHSRRATASDLTAIEAEIDAEREAMNAAARRLDGADVARQNELVGFINHRIAERSFGWSVLFDRFAEILPEDVRLISLTPRFEEVNDRRSAARTGAGREEPPRRVTLNVNAEARQGEAILEMLDALFADPAFENPNLAQEARSGGVVSFSLSVTYLPDEAEALVTRTLAADALADGEVELDAGGDVAAEDADEEGGAP